MSSSVNELSIKLTKMGIKNTIGLYDYLNSKYHGILVESGSEDLLPEGAKVRLIFLDGGALHVTSYFMNINNYEKKIYLEKVNKLNIIYWYSYASFYILEETKVHCKILITDVSHKNSFDVLIGHYHFIGKAYKDLLGI
jgi:hypothetical protein